MTDLCTRLLELPSLIETQERAVLDAIIARNEAKEALEIREALLILAGEAGPVNGKNEAIRKAQLLQATTEGRINVGGAEMDLLCAQISLRRVRDEMSVLRAVVRGSCE